MPISAWDQIRTLSLLPERNVLLADFQRADRLFRIFSCLPAGLRAVIVDVWVRMMTRRECERRIPDRLTLFLTGQCNMKCAHCFIVKERQPRLEEMTLEEIRTLFRSVAGKVSQVLLTGGEPTLRQDLAEIIISAGRDGGIPTVNLFSNGLREDAITSAIETALRDSNVCVNFQTSVDGAQVFHDLNRRVPGALDKALATVRRLVALKRRHPGRIGRIIATTALSRANLDGLEQVVGMVREAGALPAFAFVRGADNGVFNLRHPSLASDFSPEDTRLDGSPKFTGDDYLTVADMDRALQIIESALWSRLPASLMFSYNRVTLTAIRNAIAHHTSPLSQECRMGFDDLVILADGKIARCEMLTTGGSLRDTGFDLPALLTSPAWRDHLDATSGCWCTHDCGIGVSIMREPEMIKRLVHPGA